MKTKITLIIAILVVTIVLANDESARAATWTQKADMPTPRNNTATVVWNGKIYVFGGIRSFSAAQGLNSTEVSRNERDPATNLTVLSGDLSGDDNTPNQLTCSSKSGPFKMR